MPFRLAAFALFTLALPAAAETGNLSIYGVANVSFELVSNGTGAAGTPAVSGARNIGKVSSNASRLGLKGTEDIGDGYTALWQIESLIAMDNAGGSLATRNSYAGLSSSRLGRLLLGRYDTPYNSTARRLDPFIDTIADSQPLMGGTTGISAALGFAGRQTDTVLYTSPLLSGFTGNVAYIAGAETVTASNQSKGSAWSFSGIYDVVPHYAALAYEEHKLGSVGAGTMSSASAAAGSRESAWKLALGYTAERFSLGLVYERSQDNFGASGANQWGHHAYYVSGKYLMGKDALKAAYSKVGQLGPAANTGARQYTFGYDHSLSARTTLYGLYTRLHNQAAINYGLSSASSGGGTSTIVAPGSGASPSAFSLGLKHVF
ncbi:MAG: porin [Nitrosomonadales bacterium]|nr:porin [Nitrosomonadales bacterium]